MLDHIPSGYLTIEYGPFVDDLQMIYLLRMVTLQFATLG